jgi:hypothetical protein
VDFFHLEADGWGVDAAGETLAERLVPLVSSLLEPAALSLGELILGRCGQQASFRRGSIHLRILPRLGPDVLRGVAVLAFGLLGVEWLDGALSPHRLVDLDGDELPMDLFHHDLVGRLFIGDGFGREHDGECPAWRSKCRYLL